MSHFMNILSQQCVLVSGIPDGVIHKDIMEYFQDYLQTAVLYVLFPVSPGTAVIIFGKSEEYDILDLNRLIQMEHKLGGQIVSVSIPPPQVYRTAFVELDFAVVGLMTDDFKKQLQHETGVMLLDDSSSSRGTGKCSVSGSWYQLQAAQHRLLELYKAQELEEKRLLQETEFESASIRQQNGLSFTSLPQRSGSVDLPQRSGSVDLINQERNHRQSQRPRSASDAQIRSQKVSDFSEDRHRPMTEQPTHMSERPEPVTRTSLEKKNDRPHSAIPKVSPSMDFRGDGDQQDQTPRKPDLKKPLGEGALKNGNLKLKLHKERKQGHGPLKTEPSLAPTSTSAMLHDRSNEEQHNERPVPKPRKNVERSQSFSGRDSGRSVGTNGFDHHHSGSQVRSPREKLDDDIHKVLGETRQTRLEDPSNSAFRPIQDGQFRSIVSDQLSDSPPSERATWPHDENDERFSQQSTRSLRQADGEVAGIMTEWDTRQRIDRFDREQIKRPSDEAESRAGPTADSHSEIKKSRESRSRSRREQGDKFITRISGGSVATHLERTSQSELPIGSQKQENEENIDYSTIGAAAAALPEGRETVQGLEPAIMEADIYNFLENCCKDELSEIRKKHQVSFEIDRGKDTYTFMVRPRNPRDVQQAQDALNEVITLYQTKFFGIIRQVIDIHNGYVPLKDVPHVVKKAQKHFPDVYIKEDGVVGIKVIGKEDRVKAAKEQLAKLLKIDLGGERGRGSSASVRKTNKLDLDVNIRKAGGLQRSASLDRRRIKSARPPSFGRSPPSSKEETETTSSPKSALEFNTPEGVMVKIYQRDITKEGAEVIVSAANSYLSNGAGVAASISKAASHQLERQCRAYIREHGYLGVSDMMHTDAGGSLKCAYVLHVVGPIWDPAHASECEDDLFTAVAKAFMYANDKLYSKSISIPAISSGIFGVPLESCARAMAEAVQAYSRQFGKGKYLRDIRLVNIDHETTRVLQGVFAKFFGIESRREGHATNVRPSSAPTGERGRSKRRDKEEFSSHRTSHYDSGRLTSSGSHHTSNRIHRGKDYNTLHSSPPSGADDWKKMAEDQVKRLGDSTEFTDNFANLDVGGSRYSSRSRLTGTESSVQDGAFKKETLVTSKLSSNEKKCSYCSTPVHSDNFKQKCGHNFCVNCYVTYTSYDTCPACITEAKKRSMETVPQSRHSSKSTSLPPQHTNAEDGCVICQEPLTNPKTLKCKHTFCTDCIDNYFKVGKPVCPTCGEVFGVVKGDQPKGGKMEWYTDRSIVVPGYETHQGAVVITYSFPSGLQEGHHPHPGKFYTGVSRRCYLPNTTEGREVLRLLKNAFDAGVTFTIGMSRTTGREGVITWNDIHHKTNVEGGPTRFGYPDPGYLGRVKDELAAKGIK